MNRNLIIIGGGGLQLPLIETARSMGLHTIVFDMSGDAPGMKIAEEGVMMSTRDIEGCVREAKRLRSRKRIHGVITAGTDASRAVAAIANALELPGIRFADAEAASNKVLMRKRLESSGVPIPRFFSVWSVKEAREAMDEMTFPLVMKPADNMGARGVIKVRNREEILNAFRHAKRYSPTGEMILEEFMDGPELSVDALAWGGEIRITGIADRIIAKEPFFVELGHTMPSSLSPEILREAEEVMKAGMRALGIHIGAGKGDLKVTREGVKVGEIAARLSGGYMSSHTYPLHSGVNLLKAAILIALGEDPGDLEPKQNLVSIERSILAPAGRILRLEGQEEMERIRGIDHVFFTRKQGDIIQRITSNIDRAGHIIATAPTLEEAEGMVEEARKYLRLEVDETGGLDWKRVEEQARHLFGERVCHVCRVCDGEHCASGIPGMGGAGRMNTFRENSSALNEIRILPRYIHPPARPSTELEFLGRTLKLPVMGAPMTGAATNMNGAIQEKDLARILLTACGESGSLAWLGDGASPERFDSILEGLRESEQEGILILKPRADEELLVKRIRMARELPLAAVGMDIDSIRIKTMEAKHLGTLSRNADALRKLRDMTPLPFILKGVLTAEDAAEALRAGVDAIVVSNHGGRVLDDLPATARVLPDIVREVGGRIPVLADGGIRSGNDVFKMLGLGAAAVLVGRPLVIAAVGGEETAVKYLLRSYGEELAGMMEICGIPSPEGIGPEFLMDSQRNRDQFLE